MSQEITLKLSKFQEQFIKMADEPIVILTTGVGAGKTRIAAVWTVMEAIKKKCRTIAAAQNDRALTEVLFREMLMSSMITSCFLIMLIVNLRERLR